MATIAEELMNEALSEKKDNHDRSFNVYRTARHQRGGRWRAPQHSAVDYMGRKTTATRKLHKLLSSNGTYEDIQELLMCGADPKYADSKGRTPLHFAACRGDSGIVQLLISYGASVNDKDNIGNTPLHLACCSHHIRVVTSLLNAGTDILSTDCNGRTPLRLALSRLRIMDTEDDSTSSYSDSLQARKKEIEQIVDMLREYLTVACTKAKGALVDGGSGKNQEMDELEELAGKLTLSETSAQVNEVQALLHSFTEMSIHRTEQQLSAQHKPEAIHEPS